MKRLLSIFSGLIFLVLFYGVAGAAEKVVQLNVPGCRPCGAARYIDKVVNKIDGVTKHETKENDLLIITFDDKKTSIKVIVDRLKKEHLPVKGKPKFLK